jgi:hypothetical protein
MGGAVKRVPVCSDPRGGQSPILCRRISSHFSLLGFTALAAFTVNDDTGAGPVGAKDSVFEVKGLILAVGVLFLTFDPSPTLKTITTFDRNHRVTLRARHTRNLFMTMGTFHHLLNSFSRLQPGSRISVV